MKTKLPATGGTVHCRGALGLVSLLVAQTALAWPDLGVIKTGPAEAARDQIITYTLTYTNKGPVKSTQVVLKDFLPNHVSVVGGTLNGGSISGSTITWNLGTIYSRTGGSRSFQVRINTNAPVGGSITNRAEIDGEEAEESGKTANNSSKWITKIINRRPVAQNDAYTVAEDTALVVQAPGVLANDSDPDGHSLKAVLVLGPTHGTLALSTNGGFIYTPAINYNGGDAFTYKANDGLTNSAVATVSITVTPVNGPPVALNDSYTTPEDTTLNVNAPGVLSNDSDPDGDTLKAMLVTGPAHGTLTLSTNGGFIYTPAANYTGPDNFTYKAKDATANSGTATVSITVTPVNDPPVAVNDGYTTPEDTMLDVSAPGVLANDSDPDGDTLEAILISGPALGTLTLSTNGGFIYTPATNYTGTVRFSYRANDGSTNSGPATVTINVTPVNDAPVAANDSYATPEDTALSIAAPGVLANDSDADGDGLRAILASTPVHGALSLSTNGSFVYTPANNYTGGDSFTYRASDGQTNSNVATVSITVTPLNDAPVAVDDSYTVNEDTTLNVAVPGVLANDFDPESDSLIALFVSGPAHGGLTLNANGGFTYTPTTNYTGNDHFTYRAFDGQTNSNVATVTITINPLNDPPVAVNDAYTTPEGTALNMPAPGVLTNDTDVDGDLLSAIFVTGPAHGIVTLSANGSFIYVPTNHYDGQDSFTYRASDGMGNSDVAIVTITITPRNDGPVAANDSYTTSEDTALTIPPPGVLANDTDPDGDALTAILMSGPAHGTLTFSTNGSFTYTPASNYNGGDTFTYLAGDGLTNSGLATVSITVTPLNDPPVAVDDSYTVNEDTTLNVAVPGILANDSDSESDALIAVLVSGPAHGILTLNPNGGFSYTPATNYTGADSFTYRANDGALNSGVATVAINVVPVNDAPVAVNDNYTTPEDTALSIPGPGVLFNDSDVDGDSLTAVLVSNPMHGTVSLNTDGSFVYTPATNYTGPDLFTYKSDDATTDSGVATVSITVTPLNDPPVAVDDSYLVNEDTTLSVPLPGVLANDSDPEGDPLLAFLVLGPTHGTLTLGTNGNFTYRSDLNHTGTDSFTYQAFDGQTNGNIATVTITIIPVNDPPIANRDSYTTPEDIALMIAAPGILANDRDPDGDPLIAILASSPAHGTLTLNTNGGFTYVPTNHYTGLDNYTYWASDGLTNSAQVGVIITVMPVNDPPVAVNDSYTTIEDTALNIPAPGVLLNDGDVDGDVLSAVLVTGPANGSLALNPDGGFTYTPATNFTGPDSFTYKANDGTADSAIAVASITVTPVNDPPVAVDDNYSTPEDTTLTIAAPGVLTNDADPDGDPLSALLVSNPTHGTLALSANGGFTYTPATNFNGPDSFTYRASDGQASSEVATVTILVTPVNDPPDPRNWNGRDFTLYEDTKLDVGVPGLLAGILDVDLDQLMALFDSHPLHGTLTLNTNGSFSHRPATNYFGSDSFQFRIGDGQLLSPILTVNLTIIPVNDAPSFTKGGNQFHQQDAGAQTFPAWAANISPGPDNEASQSVTFQVSNDNNAMFSAQPAINAGGTLSYTPAPNAWGIATVSLIARDDGGTANGGVDSSDPQTFSITVNAPPTVSIVSPTNGASFFVPGNFTLLADAQDVDGTIEKVELFAGTNKIAEADSGAPYFTVLTNLPVGTYIYGATATDNFGATGAATPVTIHVLERPPVTFLTSVYYNPQTDFYEQRLRIHNPTYSLLDAVRIYVYNLTNTPAITVHNRSGFTQGVPYVQTHAAVAPGSFVDMTVEFHSPMRIKPNPILQAELVPPATTGAIVPGTPQQINRVLMLANKTFMIEFSTLSNRLYSIQYSSNLVHWKPVQPAISGNGNWVQWIDNGQPKTDSPPVTQPTRFYRLMLLP